MKTSRPVTRRRSAGAAVLVCLAAVLTSACAPSLNKLIDSRNRSAALQKIERASNSADLEKRDKKGRTPIHIASQKGEEQIVLALLKKGVSPDIADYAGQTPLFYAATGKEQETLKVVRVLIEHSANLEARDNKGRTPLMHAAHFAQADIVRKLLEAGAQISVKSDVGETALHLACRNALISTVMLVTKLTGKEYDFDVLYTKFIEEAVAVVEILLKAGADINAKDYDGETSLFEAIRLFEGSYRSRSLELVKFLVANGADLKSTNNKGQTPLKLATELGKADIALYLQQSSQQLSGLR